MLADVPTPVARMLFDGWTPLARTLVIGLLAYLALVLLLRISGKRTLSKWNAFDLVVTVAFGSSLATMLLSKDVALAQGIVGFALLIALQFVVTWLDVRSRAFGRLVKSQPTLLVRRGRFLSDAMRQARVPESEIRSAVRGHGIGAIEEVAAVVLESDGSFSVIRNVEAEPPTALSDVAGWDEAGFRLAAESKPRPSGIG